MGDSKISAVRITSPNLMTVTNDGMIVKTTYLHTELHIMCVCVCVRARVFILRHVLRYLKQIHMDTFKYTI